MSDTTSLTSSSSTWRTSVLRALAVYAFSRVCVLLGAGIVSAQRVVDANKAGVPRPSNAGSLILEVLNSWDGLWYYEIIRNGYPRSIPPNVTYDMDEARAAFFPVYPTVVRWLDAVLPGGDVWVALTLNLVLGAVAMVLIGLLARDCFDERIGRRTMYLVALFPGSFVLSFAYSEATLLVLAAACLLALQRRMWLVAGLLATIGTATRPNGVALVAACAVAALLAIRDRREWRSLIAPALAPIGFIGFQLFLRQHAGEAAPWFRVQREAWREGTSFGASAVRGTLEAFLHPLASPTDVITAVSFITTLVLVWAAWRKRLPWPLVAYAAVVLALMLMPSTVTARPRFLYTAFPLLIAAAAWLPDDEDERWSFVLAACSAGLVTLTALYGVYGAIP